MPKRKGSKKSRNSKVLIGGGDIITQSSCGAQLDTSRYTAPCKANSSSLPLDPGFGGSNIVSRHFGGGMSGGGCGGCAVCGGGACNCGVMSGGNFTTSGKIMSGEDCTTCGKMTGGGLTVAVDRPQIAGRPEIVAYSDHAPPVFLNNKTVTSQDGQALCGAQQGGKSKRKTTKRRIRKANKKRSRKLRRKNRKAKTNKKHNRKNRKTRNKRRH